MAVPQGRCGRELTRTRNYGTRVCWRRTWKGTENCIWHAKHVSKPFRSLQIALEQEPEKDLCQSFLRGVSFSRLKIDTADLTGADLRNSDFSGVYIRDFDFTGANLKGANFSDIKGGATVGTGTAQLFTDCNLRDTDFSNTNVSGIDFSTVDDINKVDFSDSILNSTDISGVSIQKADFSNADIRGTDFSDSSLSYSDFTDAQALSADFSGCDLHQARFIRTELDAADLRDAELYGVFMSNPRLRLDTKIGEDLIYEKRIHNTDDVEKKTEFLHVSAWVYNILMNAAKENNLPNLAREFYRRKQTVRHRESKLSDGLMKRIWWDLSRQVSYYGDSPVHVVRTSLFVIGFTAFLYPCVGGIAKSSNNSIISFSTQGSLNLEMIFDVIYFSVITFTTLGYGDFHPAGLGGKSLAMLESFFGALLMALLVFVLGRRSTW